jgi:hypothetical protein
MTLPETALKVVSNVALAQLKPLFANVTKR